MSIVRDEMLPMTRDVVTGKHQALSELFLERVDQMIKSNKLRVIEYGITDSYVRAEQIKLEFPDTKDELSIRLVLGGAL